MIDRDEFNACVSTARHEGLVEKKSLPLAVTGISQIQSDFYFFFVFLVSSHSSKVMLRSTTPFGVSSKTRLATVWTNSWS